MPFSLSFTEEFKHDLARLDNSIKQRLPKIFDKIKENPTLAKPLHGKWGYYRIRFLNYRIIYHVFEKEERVLLVAIGKRDVVYG